VFRTACLLCGNRDLCEIIDLGMHPFADTFIPADSLSRCDKLYPLVCDVCLRCGQIQLRTVTEPEARYQDCEYSYTSSNSAFSRRHWVSFAETVSRHIGLQPGELVIELGSNDGFLAAQFKAAGQRVLGVDPSKAMAYLAQGRGVKTVIGFFSEALADNLVARTGPARLIVANNVANHANDPLDFMRGVRRLLADDGTFVFELPYWLRQVEQHRIDQIYHEHVTYFTVTYAAALTRAAGLTLTHVEEVDYHGGSLRAYCRKAGEVDESVDRLRRLELEAGVFLPETYSTLMATVGIQRSERLERIHRITRGGESLVAIGAAAKGNTFLNYYGLNSTIIDVVTDASPQKIGKYTPATRIPITPDSHLASYERGVHAIVLAWNLTEALRKTLRDINPHIQFLEDDA